MIEQPTESGSYIVDATFEGENRDVTILHWTELSEPTRLRTGFWDCQCRIEEIHAYRRLTDNDLRELLHGPQESGPPDRPGWWRCRYRDDMEWMVRNVPEVDGVLRLDDYGYGSMPISEAIANGWIFADRVRMPGEET